MSEWLGGRLGGCFEVVQQVLDVLQEVACETRWVLDEDVKVHVELLGGGSQEQHDEVAFVEALRNDRLADVWPFTEFYVSDNPAFLRAEFFDRILPFTGFQGLMDQENSRLVLEVNPAIEHLARCVGIVVPDEKRNLLIEGRNVALRWFCSQPEWGKREKQPSGYVH